MTELERIMRAIIDEWCDAHGVPPEKRPQYRIVPPDHFPRDGQLPGAPQPATGDTGEPLMAAPSDPIRDMQDALGRRKPRVLR